MRPVVCMPGGPVPAARVATAVLGIHCKCCCSDICTLTRSGVSVARGGWAQYLSVGQLVRLLDGGGGGGGGQLLLVVDGHVGQLLLDVAHDLALRAGGEGVAALGEDLHQVVRQVAPRQVQAGDGVRQRIPLVDGHCTAGAAPCT